MLSSQAPLFAPETRRAIRYLAAAIAAGCAVVYLAIGFGLIYPPKDDAQFLLVFGLSSAFMFGLGAVLLVRSDRRLVVALGALFQVLVIVAYFQVSGRRDPHFEIWGLSLKVAQGVILALLAALLLPERVAQRGR